MGVSILVSAIKPPNETWQKHKAIYDACNAADIEPPNEVWRYFNDEPPDDDGVAIGLGSIEYPKAPMESIDGGVRIDLKGLPEDVRFIKLVWG